MTDIAAWLLAIYAEDAEYEERQEMRGRISPRKYAEVLADFAAKKAIVEAYQEAATLWEATGSERSLPAASIDGAFVALEHALRLLASAHADRPGYQAEWAVE